MNKPAIRFLDKATFAEKKISLMLIESFNLISRLYLGKEPPSELRH